MNVEISSLKKSEIKKVAKIASQCFSGLKDIKKARKWVSCNFKAFPRMKYFVASKDKKIFGYILWLEKGGFRKEAVFELEQIAVSPGYQGKGIGTKLIKQSLEIIKKDLKKRNSKLKLIEVTTGKENRAQILYKKTLGAEVECIVRNLFRGDEVIMIARFK